MIILLNCQSLRPVHAYSYIVSFHSAYVTWSHGRLTASWWKHGWCTTGSVLFGRHQLAAPSLVSLLLMQLMTRADVNLPALPHQWAAAHYAAGDAYLPHIARPKACNTTCGAPARRSLWFFFSTLQVDNNRATGKLLFTACYALGKQRGPPPWANKCDRKSHKLIMSFYRCICVYIMVV